MEGDFIIVNWRILDFDLERSSEIDKLVESSNFQTRNWVQGENMQVFQDGTSLYFYKCNEKLSSSWNVSVFFID